MPTENDRSRPGQEAAPKSHAGDNTDRTARLTLSPAGQRVLEAHRERPWPSLDVFIAAGNRRAQLARWASHLARVAQAPECTSRDVEAAVGRLLPLLQAVGR